MSRDMKKPIEYLPCDAKDETDQNENKDRGTWTKDREFIIACISYAVGLANFWRFPYVCIRNGGGAFLIPYFTMLVLCGIPIYSLEMFLGQFSSLGTSKVWSITPISQGVGWASAVVSGVVCVYYNVVLAWATFYLGISLNKDLPWKTCDNWWNTDTCMETTFSLATNASSFDYKSNATEEFDNSRTVSNISNNAMSATEEFWSYRILDISSGIDDIGTVKWYLALSFLAMCILLFICVCRGVKTAGKAVYFTTFVPYIILLVFLIRGVTLPGSLNGIYYYLVPDWNKVLTFKVWCEACLQVFFSLGCGMGACVTFSSYNNFHHNCFRDAIITCTVCGITSFISGFVVFSILGFMAHGTGKPFENVVTHGPGLTFVVYPEAMQNLPVSPLWAVLFFAVLIFLGLGCQVGNIETVITAITDLFPILQKKYRSLFVGIMTIIVFILGLPFVTEGGMYVFQICDWYASPFALVVIGFCECITVVYFYGIGRFAQDVEFMTHMKLPYFLVTTWCAVCPCILLIILLVNAVEMMPPTYGDYVYPDWAIACGWILAAVGLAPIPSLAIVAFVRARGSIRNRLVTLISPSKGWGPARSEHKAQYHSLSRGIHWCQRMSLRHSVDTTPISGQEKDEALSEMLKTAV